MNGVNQYTISIPLHLSRLPDKHFIDELKAVIEWGEGNPENYRFFKIEVFDPAWRRSYSRIDAIHRSRADQAFINLKGELGDEVSEVE